MSCEKSNYLENLKWKLLMSIYVRDRVYVLISRDVYIYFEKILISQRQHFENVVLILECNSSFTLTIFFILSCCASSFGTLKNAPTTFNSIPLPSNSLILILSIGEVINSISTDLIPLKLQNPPVLDLSFKKLNILLCVCF